MNQMHSEFCGAQSFEAELGAGFVEVKNTQMYQLQQIDTRAADGASIFGEESTQGFDFQCRLKLKPEKGFAFGFGEVLDIIFELGEVGIPHRSTLI